MQASRRSALGLLAAGAALVSRAEPSQAAYGESANIFGKTTNKAGESSCGSGCGISNSLCMYLHAFTVCSTMSGV